jgi:hypothetical protein
VAITLVQSNGSASTGTLDATPPAWGSSPVAGNLLIICCCEVNITAGTWGTTPAGYTAMPFTPFQFYTAGIGGVYGGYWKIAAGGDATPGHIGETTSTQDWVTYTYEFANPNGWLTSPVDQETHTAAGTATGTASASGSSGTLAQAQELAICIVGHDVTVPSPAFTNGYVSAPPTTNNGKLGFAWQETASTAAVSTTASWSVVAARWGVKQVTFMTATAAAPSATLQLPGQFPSHVSAAC